MIGDMAIKDLTPKTTNLGDRLVKNLRICGSGIYTYNRSEAELLHLAPVPKQYESLRTINVFRPPEVLEKCKDLFARVPIITGSHVLVTPDNAKRLAVGMVGDTVQAEVCKDDGELYLYTTGTIIAGDGIEAYEKYGQLSVGYDPIIEWEPGVHNGVEYQAVLKGFHDINHLLICPIARGGPQCMVMDSITPLELFVQKTGGEDMGIFNKIFGKEKPAIVGDAAVVSTLLQSIACGADPETQVSKVRAIVGDSDTTFNEYLDELARAKEEKREVVAQAVNIVDKYYNEHLAGDRRPEGKPEDKPEEKPEEKPAEGDEAPEDKPSEGDKEPAEDDKKQVAAGDSIDMDKLATMVAARIVGAQQTKAQVEQPAVPMSGDQKPAGDSFADFTKEIWG